MGLWTDVLSWWILTQFEECWRLPMESLPELPKNLNIGNLTLIQTLWPTVVYWLPYSSHTSHHLPQTPCLPWISNATQTLMLDSCKMVDKQSEAFHTFLYYFFHNNFKFQYKNRLETYRMHLVSFSFGNIQPPKWYYQFYWQNFIGNNNCSEWLNHTIIFQA